MSGGSEDQRKGPLLHGAYEPKRVIERADKMEVEAYELLADLPWVRSCDRYEAEAWLRSEARVRMLAGHLEKVGLTDRTGEIRRFVLQELRAEERLASERRNNLGMNPRTRAVMERDYSSAALNQVDLVSALSKGREFIAAAQARGALPADSSEA